MSKTKNFFVDVYIDGQKPFSGGPKDKDGGIMIEVFQRDNGGTKKACTLYCTVGDNGVLVTEVEDHSIHGNIYPILRTVR